MNALSGFAWFIFVGFLSLGGGAGVFAAMSPMGYDAAEALEQLEGVLVGGASNLNGVDSSGMSAMALIAMGRLDLAVALLYGSVGEAAEHVSVSPVLLSHPGSECHVCPRHQEDPLLVDLYQSYTETWPGNQKLCFDPGFYQRSAFVEALEESSEDYENFVSILAEAVNLLVDHGATVNGVSGDTTALLLAAQQPGFTTLIDALLKHGARIDVSDSLGYNALHFAVLARNYDACKLLLEAGVDPLSASCFGYTPVQLAAAHPVISVMEEYSILTEETVSKRLDRGQINLGHLKINEDRELVEPIRELLFEYQGSRACYFLVEESPYIYYQGPEGPGLREAYIDSRRSRPSDQSTGFTNSYHAQQSYMEWVRELVEDNSVKLMVSGGTVVLASHVALLFMKHYFQQRNVGEGLQLLVNVPNNYFLHNNILLNRMIMLALLDRELSVSSSSAAPFLP